MNLNDIMGNTDRQQIFDTVLEEACRQWCAVLPDAPERMDGEGFANFFYKIFEQKEAERNQEAVQSKEAPAEKAEANAAPPKETADKPAQEAAAVADSPPNNRPVQEEQAVQEFMKLLMEHRPDKGQDYSMMLFQMDGMARQLEAALNELQVVKRQLADVRESPAKNFITRAVNAVENRLHTMQERLSDIKDHIVENAKQAVAGFKQKGVAALDKAVAALHVKKGLEAMQQDLSESISDIKQSIGKIETIGHELRSVGGHIKNVGRAVTGKEQQLVDGGSEGRFQAAILAPMRAEKKILSSLNNMALAAIGGVERLEQAAGREPKQPDKTEPEQSVELDEELEPPVAREEKKPSVLKDLQEKKAQAAARPAPAPDKERKPQEAAL